MSSSCKPLRSASPPEVHHPASANELGDLDPEAVEILESFSKEQVLFAKGVSNFLAAGALDLYTGVGGVARYLVRNGAPWALCFEISRSADEDVLDPKNQQKILRLIVLKAVKVVGSALWTALGFRFYEDQGRRWQQDGRFPD